MHEKNDPGLAKLLDLRDETLPPALQKTLPDGVAIVPFYDREDLVLRVIRTVRNSLLEGGLLVVAVLLAFLGNLRAGLIVAAAIPFSMLIAFAGMALGSATAFAQTPLTYTDGDLFLGFRVKSGTDNQGLTSDYLVNIGQFSTYENATGPITVSGLGSMKADLDATFGSNWSARDNVYWSVSGKAEVATSALFATKPQIAPGTINATGWARASAIGLSAVVPRSGISPASGVLVTSTGPSPSDTSACASAMPPAPPVSADASSPRPPAEASPSSAPPGGSAGSMSSPPSGTSPTSRPRSGRCGRWSTPV